MRQVVLVAAAAAAAAAAGPKLVLNIAIDDMRPSFGKSFNFPLVKTPRIDELAANGVAFQRAYCQAATCGVSRSSLLTGRRVDTTGVYDNGQCFYKTGGNWTSLPHYMKDNGYVTWGGGKIFHPGVCAGHAVGEDPAAWSLPYYAEPCPGHGSFPCADPFTPSARPHAYYANQTATDAETPDGMIVRAAAAALRNFSAQGRFASERLFLAAGIHRPHLPEIMPDSYFAAYDPADIPPPDNPRVPEGLPSVAWNDCGEIRSYVQVKEQTANFSEHTPFPPGLTAGMRRAYFAAQTFADAQVGFLLDAVKDAGLSLEEDVCVVLWGDHGWHLGEQNEWAKHTEHERAVRSTLLFAGACVAPSQRGTSSDAFTELIDIYPTVADVAGIDVPELCPENSTDIAACSEGSSLRPLLEGTASQVKNASFFQWPKTVGGHHVMGYGLRGDKYHFVQWVAHDRAKRQGNFSHVYGEELYDLVTDPHETTNLAATQPDREPIKHILDDFRWRAKHGWRTALPHQG